MLAGRHICQLRYTKRGFPMIAKGRVVEEYRMEDIEKYVEEQRPSLVGKPYKIAFSNQRV